MTEATLSAKVTADIADFNRKFGEMRSTLDKLGGDLGGELKGTNQALGQMDAKLGGIGKVLSAGVLVEIGKGLNAFIAEPLIGIGREAITMADKMNQSQNAFTTMLGSADKAKQFLRELQDLAVKTPFEFTQLQDASKRLLAMGIAAEKIPDMITRVGDAVSGLGSGTQGFDRITTAIGQMNAKGRATAEEMKQFTEAGIGAWDALAKHLNVSVAQAMEMVTKRQVDSATAITAIMAGMGERFGGLMAQQSATVEGQLSNLRDTSAMILTGIGQELITALKLPEVIAAVGAFAREFLTWFTSLDEGTKQVILVVTGAFAASGPILVAVGAFMAAMAFVTAPMLTGGAIVAGIIAGVGLIILNWQRIKDTGTAIWTGLTNTVKTLIDRMVSGIDTAIAKLGAILDGVRAKTEAVSGFFRKMYDAVVGHSYVPDMVDEIGQHMKKLDANLTAPARRAAISVENVFRGMSFTATDVLEDLRERASFTAGSMIQSMSGAFAGALQGTTNWSQVGQQMLNQFLTNAIGMVLTWTTTWAAGELMRATATTAANATIAGSTAATMGAMTAVVSTALTGLKMIALAVARTAVSVVGTVIAAITPVLIGVSTVIATVMTTVGTMLINLGTAMQSIPIVGNILGAIVIAMGGAAIALGAALPGVVAGLMGGLAGAAGALGSAIPAMAAGGIVTRPTLALIGEAGPEAVVPLGRRGGFDADRRPVTIVVELDGAPILRHVTNQLPAMLRLKGLPA